MQLREIARKIRDNFVEVSAGLGLVLVVIITIYNVINRYILMGSAVWAPELAGMIFSWMVFLGAYAALKRGMHISISVVVRQLNPRLQAWIARLGDVLLTALFAYATYLALKITLSSYSRISPAMHVPFSYVYASAAVGFALMFLNQIAALAKAFRSRTDSQPD
jgi:TRAP-type transport system small permease protein